MELNLVCPYCGYKMRYTFAISVPRTGDVLLCSDCTNFLFFDTPTTIRKPTPQDMERFRSSPNYAAYIHAQTLMVQLKKEAEKRNPE